MSVANFPYRQVRYFTASENVPSVLAGNVAANTLGDAISAPLIVNADGSESRVTLSPGTYTLSAETFVIIANAQTACQKMELCLHEILPAGFVPEPVVIGASYTGAAIDGAALTMVNIQFQLQLRVLTFHVATTRTFVIRIDYNGMPDAANSSADFSTLSFIKTSDETSISEVNFKT